MSACSVTLTANAGAAIRLGGLCVWVDALHTQKIPGFSALSQAQWSAMEAGCCGAPDILVFTHCHGDHFSRTLAAKAQALWPQSRLVLPEALFPRQLLLAGPGASFRAGDVQLRFFRLPHEGSQYKAVPHYGAILTCGAFRLLIAGDCQVASPALAEALEGVIVDLALLDFPWITLRRGRDFTERVFRPGHLFVNHLPFSGDDVCGYRPAARRAAAALSLHDVRLLTEPFQRESVLF